MCYITALSSREWWLFGGLAYNDKEAAFRLRLAPGDLIRGRPATRGRATVAIAGELPAVVGVVGVGKPKSSATRRRKRSAIWPGAPATPTSLSSAGPCTRAAVGSADGFRGDGVDGYKRRGHADDPPPSTGAAERDEAAITTWVKYLCRAGVLRCGLKSSAIGACPICAAVSRCGRCALRAPVAAGRRVRGRDGQRRRERSSPVPRYLRDTRAPPRAHHPGGRRRPFRRALIAGRSAKPQDSRHELAGHPPTKSSGPGSATLNARSGVSLACRSRRGTPVVGDPPDRRADNPPRPRRWRAARHA